MSKIQHISSSHPNFELWLSSVTYLHTKSFKHLWEFGGKCDKQWKDTGEPSNDGNDTILGPSPWFSMSEVIGDDVGKWGKIETKPQGLMYSHDMRLWNREEIK